MVTLSATATAAGCEQQQQMALPVSELLRAVTSQGLEHLVRHADRDGDGEEVGAGQPAAAGCASCCLRCRPVLPINHSIAEQAF